LSAEPAKRYGVRILAARRVLQWPTVQVFADGLLHNVAGYGGEIMAFGHA
jgi:hypothetical protein